MARPMGFAMAAGAAAGRLASPPAATLSVASLWMATLSIASVLALGAAGGAAACGAGELELPGTAGCVRLGGVARAEAAAGSAAPRRIVPADPGDARSATGPRFRARGGARVDLDARVPTASGPLRAYLSAGTGGPARR